MSLAKAEFTTASSPWRPVKSRKPSSRISFGGCADSWHIGRGRRWQGHAPRGPRLLAAGAAVHGYVTTARWVNIDTPRALADADAELRRQPFRY